MILNDHLLEQLRSAYDCYLQILRCVQQRQTEALERHPRDEMTFLLCAPCFNELDGEAPLIPRFLAAIDGNSSLKLVDSSYQSGTSRSDDRLLPSRRWLEPEVVDLFKDETKTSATRQKVRQCIYLFNGSYE
jgi:hypothetical protein